MPIVKIAEVKNGITSITPYNKGTNISEKFFIENGDILFSWSADLDVYQWVHGKAIFNQHLFHVKPKTDYCRYFLFHALKFHMVEFRSRSLGTTMRHIKRSALDQVKTSIPPKNIQELFDKQIEAISKQVINLQTKISVLRKTRASLLPKLVSGEIDVSEMGRAQKYPSI